MNLAEALVGDVLVVEHVGGDRAFRRRLMELGLVRGTPLSLLSQAPFGGPLKLCARGCTLSIRREEAGCITVRGDGRLRSIASAALVLPRVLEPRRAPN